MGTREDFIKSLKSYKGNEKFQKPRDLTKIYRYEGKAKDIVKKPGLYKRVSALILAGAILATPIYKSMSAQEIELTDQQRQEMVNKEVREVIPAELYIQNKEAIESLQNDTYEYNKLDTRLIKNAEEKDKFSKLEKELAKKDEFVESLYLNLVKYSIAKEAKIEDYTKLRTIYRASGGETHVSVINTETNTTLDMGSISDYNIRAIESIGNFQSVRTQAMGDESTMAQNVAKLNESMMAFAKVSSKKNVKMLGLISARQSKHFDEER